jgi:hypothetical protein
MFACGAAGSPIQGVPPNPAPHGRVAALQATLLLTEENSIRILLNCHPGVIEL